MDNFEDNSILEGSSGNGTPQTENNGDTNDLEDEIQNENSDDGILQGDALLNENIQGEIHPGVVQDDNVDGDIQLEDEIQNENMYNDDDEIAPGDAIQNTQGDAVQNENIQGEIHLGNLATVANKRKLPEPDLITKFGRFESNLPHQAPPIQETGQPGK